MFKSGLPLEVAISTDILNDGSDITINDIFFKSIELVSEVNIRGEEVRMVHSTFGYAVHNFEIEGNNISFRASFLGSVTKIVYVYELSFSFARDRECDIEWWLISESM